MPESARTLPDTIVIEHEWKEEGRIKRDLFSFRPVGVAVHTLTEIVDETEGCNQHWYSMFAYREDQPEGDVFKVQFRTDEEEGRDPQPIFDFARGRVTYWAIADNIHQGQQPW